MRQVSLPGGEMGRRIHGHDWAATPLGPRESWPAALRSAVDIALSSRAQIVIFWGPDYVALYNDPYIPTIGAKHPAALGRPAVENWSETWDVLKPLLDEVRKTGEPFWAQDHLFLLERHGFLEETYFDVSYGPIRLEDQTVGGVMCLVSETTGRVLGERRMRTLSRVGEAANGRATRDEVARAALSALAEARDDVPFALAYLAGDADDLTGDADGLTGDADDEPGGGASVPPVGGTGRDAPHTSSDGNGPGGDGSRGDESRGDGSGEDGTGEDAYGGAAELRIVVPDGAAPERIGAGEEPAWFARAVTAVPGERFGARGPAVALPLTSGAGIRGLLVCGVNPRLQPYDEFFGMLATSVSRALSAAEAHERERGHARRLARLDADKTAFFANVSHELRTPLTLILGPLEELLEDPSIGPEQGAVLRTARRNAVRLLTLLDDVLDVTSFDAGRTRAYHRPADLVAQTTELVSVFRSAAESVGLTLTVESEPLPEPVFLDRRMWERIVFNLLSNAVKHTFSGGVTVGVRSGGDHAVVTVSDTGIGIPGGEIPHLFERFRRVPGSRARSHEGAGIGLALVHELVGQHGGRIEASSVVGEGTTFTIRLPYGSAHLPPSQVGEAAQPYEPGTGYLSHWLPLPGESSGRLSADGIATPAGPRGPERILVADDNEDLRHYLVRLLSPYWSVTAVADGAAALRAAREEVPDMIVADVMMPGMDGLDLVRRLRADEVTRSVPIMLLSAKAGQEASLSGLIAGADEYLAKPFSARELLTRVRGVLSLSAVRSRHNRQLRELTEAALALNGASSTAEVLALAETYGERLAGTSGVKVALTDDTTGHDDRDTRTGTVRIAVSGGDPGRMTDDTVLRRLAQLTSARLRNLERFEQEHRIATTLQLALLPEVPEIGGTAIVGRYVPGSDEAGVGGDWYDVIRISDTELVLVIGDIVGKGLRAAASMGRMRNALRAYALEDPDPGRTLGRLNRMTAGRHDRMHATVLCVRLSLTDGRVEYASAGHPPALVCTADGRADFLGGALSPLIGAMPFTDFPTGTTRLERGDRLLLYTDGIVENRSRNILDGMNRLSEEMARASRLDLGAMLESLLTLVEGGEKRDDVALLGFARA
ncbi:SpoIIE family protein phosphatase [Streptosporangium sp. NPDC023615]|uniref:SpoIIE family protein phosphatase n=1 Tax=Streptosporangium sp. NPDC023615 TaxID=3154794 RepID=UPI003447C91A